MNIRKWSGQNHNTVIIHEAPENFNVYFVHFAFLDTYGGHLYIYDNIEFAFLVCIHKHNCPQAAYFSHYYPFLTATVGRGLGPAGHFSPQV